MSKEKDAVIHRIRSLLAKTVSNGCSEAEAMMAASKAAEIMDQHDIQTIDLGEKSVFVELVRQNVRHDIMKRTLAVSVAKYCGCFIVLSGSDMKMMGRDIDIVMAEWLYDTLVNHVARGLKDHMSGCHTLPSYQKTSRKNGFILGACNRIGERLGELMEVRVSQSNALVLTRATEARSAFIEQLESTGGKLGKSRKARSLYAGDSSMSAGRAHGDKATFNRPVANSGSNKKLG